MLNDPTLQTSVAIIIERCINTALRFDPATKAKLANIDGAILAFQCLRPELKLFFCVDTTAINVKSYCEIPPDVTISGELADFINVMSDSSKTFAASELSVSGKIHVLSQLQEILADADIDWEEPLADIIGVVPGHLVAQSARNAWQWLNTQKRQFEQNFRPYLEEELRAIPSQVELQSFYDDVDDTNARLNRVEARIQRLNQSSPAK